LLERVWVRRKQTACNSNSLLSLDLKEDIKEEENHLNFSSPLPLQQERAFKSYFNFSTLNGDIALY